MELTKVEVNKALVLKAFDTLFNKQYTIEEVWTNAHKAKENQGANDQ